MSFQHATETVLRRMNRFGSRGVVPRPSIAQIRAAAPDAGIRSNVIVGFPGETEAELAELEAFLIGARLDAVGVFGYSDEDGTAAAGPDGKIDHDEIDERVERITALVEEVTSQRAEDRIGTVMTVLVDDLTGRRLGRGEHQAPEVDGSTTLLDADGVLLGARAGRVVGAGGSILVARAIEVLHAGSRRRSTAHLPRAGALNERTAAGLAGQPAERADRAAADPGPGVPVGPVRGGGHRLPSDGWPGRSSPSAAITDRFDGQIARKRGQVTDFGKIATHGHG